MYRLMVCISWVRVRARARCKKLETFEPKTSILFFGPDGSATEYWTLQWAGSRGADSDHQDLGDDSIPRTVTFCGPQGGP